MSAVVASLVFLPGLLDPPSGLEIDYHNITHQVLSWTPPFTLDLTAYQDDITGYSVTLEMENPPPHDPYNFSVFRDDLPSTSHQSWSVSGQSPQFFFPRYSFPVWLSVTAENPVGLGAPSPLLKYPPPTSPHNCTRLRGAIVQISVIAHSIYSIADVVSGVYLEIKVEFSGSANTPSVEALLYKITEVESVLCLFTSRVAFFSL